MWLRAVGIKWIEIETKWIVTKLNINFNFHFNQNDDGVSHYRRNVIIKWVNEREIEKQLIKIIDKREIAHSGSGAEKRGKTNRPKIKRYNRISSHTQTQNAPRKCLMVSLMRLGLFLSKRLSIVKCAPLICESLSLRNSAIAFHHAADVFSIKIYTIYLSK